MRPIHGEAEVRGQGGQSCAFPRGTRAELGMAMVLELPEVVIGSGAGRQGEVVERWMDGSMELAGFGWLVLKTRRGWIPRGRG